MRVASSRVRSMELKLYPGAAPRASRHADARAAKKVGARYRGGQRPPRLLRGATRTSHTHPAEPVNQNAQIDLPGLLLKVAVYQEPCAGHPGAVAKPLPVRTGGLASFFPHGGIRSIGLRLHRAELRFKIRSDYL